MSDAFSMWRHTKMVVLVALTAALYAALLVPFKPIPIIPGITELRPANVVPVVCSLLFGPAAAWGAAIGNLVGDFFGTLGPGSFFGFIGNFLLGYLPYRIWRLIAGGARPTGAPALVPAFFVCCVISSAVCGLVIAWGVDLLGLVPFKILATVIALNNTVAAFALGVVLLPLLYPRAERWRLVYWEIMPEDELSDSALAWPALIVIVALSLAGTSWAAMLWFSPGGLPQWAAAIPTRLGAAAVALILFALSACLARPPAGAPLRAEDEQATVQLQRPEGLPAPSPAIAVRDISFTYQGADAPALANVSFTQEPGQFRCVMGRTGAGKTTLCLTLAGVVPWLEAGEFSGMVEICTRRVSGTPPRHLAGLVALVQQDFETQLLGSQVEGVVACPLENLAMAPEEIAARVEYALAATGTHHLRHRDPNLLSGGEKQRVALAAALALQPRVLVLDEPTTDLDPAGRAQIIQAWEKLRQGERAFIVAEHDPHVAALSDVLTVLDAGRVIYDGPPQQLLSDPERCRAAGILPPEAAEIAAALGLASICSDDELIAELRRLGARCATDVALPPAAAEWATPGDVLISAQGLAAGYGAADVLAGVDLQVREGEVVALLGRNGSGKTTLARCIDGLLRPTAGHVQLAGRQPTAMTRPEVARIAGMLFQNPDHQLIATTVAEEVRLGPRLAGLEPAAAEEGVQWALAVTGLERYTDEDPFALPKGLRQKVALTSVLAFKPPVIIFDEPTTGLDGPEQVEMMELLVRLAQEGRAVLVITHAVWAAARYASRIALIANGRILADGPPREVLANTELLEQAGIQPPASVTVSRQALGCTLLAPWEFAERVQIGRSQAGGVT